MPPAPRKRSFRPDHIITPYVVREAMDEFGHSYPISLSRLACAPPAVPPRKHSPVTARDIERRAEADLRLVEAVRLARIIPRFDAPPTWCTGATYEARS